VRFRLGLFIAGLIAAAALASLTGAIAGAANGCPTASNQSGKNFNGSNLNGCNLAGFNFSGANLNKTTFVGANLTGANFKGANLNQNDFDTANVDGAVFDGDNLNKATFVSASGTHTTFTGANMNGVALDHGNFSFTNVTGANTNKVTCAGTNLYGLIGKLSCAGSVSISPDATPPVITVPSSITAEATSASGASVSYSVSATDDVDGSVTATCSPQSGSTFPFGITTVNCSATDHAGNTGHASFTVTVHDTTPPSVTVPSDITQSAASDGGAVVTFTVTASDNINGSLVPGCDLSSGSTFPVGTTTVTCTALDGSGNSASGSFKVAITASAPGAPTVTGASASDGAATVSFNPPASDGGSAVTSYTVTSSPGGLTASCSSSPCTVTGLTDGQSYFFTVTAANAMGSSPASAPSPNPVVPIGLPGAPTVTGVSGDDRGVTLTFDPPASDGGLAIDSYTVTAQPGGETFTCLTSPCELTGLTDGQSYTFTIAATTLAGTGSASGESASATPVGAPGAPTITGVVPGDGSATVSFDAPASDGGSPIIGYTVTSNPGGLTATCPASPCTVTGLSDGVSYSFTAVAENAVGNSIPSAAADPVVPIGVPGAPTGVSASVDAASKSATVSFTPPIDSGGSPITNYTVASNIGGLTASGGASPITVSDLVPGTSYTFTVVAANAVGSSAASAPSAPVVLYTAPGPPQNVTAVAGINQAGVTFSAPVSDGGSPVMKYTVTTSPGGLTASTTSVTPVLINGLVNGTAYTFTVTATNAYGTSNPSTPSAAVTPRGPPNAPTNITASAIIPFSDRATVSWTPSSSNGGSPITSYTVTSSPGNQQATCSAAPCTIFGLIIGSSYTFTVIASNGVGNSPSSSASPPFIPLGPPGAPSITGVSQVPGGIAISFLPPVSNGGQTITQYAATATPGGTVTSGPSSPVTITGLTQGQNYTFTLTATNAQGTGPSSETSTPITPGPLASIHIVLDFSFALEAWINVNSGNVYDPSNGGETDPNDGSVQVPPYPPGQAPKFVQIDPNTSVVSFDQSSQRYFSYRYSTFDPTPSEGIDFEFDRAGNAIGAVDPSQPLLILTDSIPPAAVDLNDQINTDIAGFTGILLDPVSLQPLDGNTTPVHFTPLQTPQAWLY
jgi:hypothetical protein